MLLGLARLRSKGVSQPDRSLLDAFGVLALFFAGSAVASPDGRVAELFVLLASATLFLAAPRQTKKRRLSDEVLLALATIDTFLVVVFSYLFPTDLLRLSWREPWLQFRYVVLPHWSDFWWFRWGVVAVIAAMVAGLLCSRARRTAA